jgi:hypothetical protein
LEQQAASGPPSAALFARRAGFFDAGREYVLGMCFGPAVGQELANCCGIARQQGWQPTQNVGEISRHIEMMQPSTLHD